MGTLKCVCSYLSRDIRANQLEHTLLRVPICVCTQRLTFCKYILKNSRFSNQFGLWLIMTASEENSSSGSESGDSSDNEKQRVKSTIRRVSPSEPKNSKSSGSDRSRSSSENRQSQRRRRSPTRSRSRSNSRSRSRQDDDRKNQGIDISYYFVM